MGYGRRNCCVSHETPRRDPPVERAANVNLKHLHLHVRDRSAAEAFYCDWFGLTTARRGDRISFLSDGADFDLALMDDDAPDAMPSWFHFGFRLDSPLEVATLHGRMRDALVPIAKPLYEDESLASFRCADPDGYVIEVYWEAAKAPLD